MRLLISCFAAILLLVWSPGGNEAVAANVLSEFGRLMGDNKSPFDKLFTSLAVIQMSCDTTFRLSSTLTEPANVAATRSKAEKCQSDGLVEGNTTLSEFKGALAKSASQSALRELTVFFRMQMADLGSRRTEDQEVLILRHFKYLVERIRVEEE